MTGNTTPGKTKIIVGFAILFTLYHGAEYFVLFRYNPVAFLSIQVIFFIAADLIARWQGFKGISAWGLEYKSTWVKQLVAGMIMGIFLYSTSFIISIGIKSEEIVNIPSLNSMLGPLALFCFGNFFSSFSEDIFTRGYVFRHLNKKVPVPLIALTAALIYLLNHIYRLNDGWQTLSYLFALGLLFIIPVLLTKRLWFTGGMHWLGNTTFYFTHNVMAVKPGASTLPANTILFFCILAFIPLLAVLIRVLKLYDGANAT